MKTIMFLATLTALLLWVGHALAGQGGLWVALVGHGPLARRYPPDSTR
jgi:hypothetical protein